MLKKLFALLIAIVIISNSYSQPEKELAEAFIQSVAKNNFGLLNPYLYNAQVAKKLFAAEFNKLTPAKQAEAIQKYKKNLQKKWATAVKNAKSNTVDFNKVKLKQAVVSPLEGMDIFSSLLITYEYNGSEWDDLFLIINKQGTSKYIVDIPNDTRMFAFNEYRKGKNLEAFSQEKDKNDPNMKQHLKDAVELLKNLAQAKDTAKLYKHLVYTGEEDKENRWRRTIDPSKPEDVESSRRIIDKIINGFENCTQITYGDVRTDKESEGVWYVINTTCGKQKHTYAFLKIKNTFVLGDID